MESTGGFVMNEEDKHASVLLAVTLTPAISTWAALMESIYGERWRGWDIRIAYQISVRR